MLLPYLKKRGTRVQTKAVGRESEAAARVAPGHRSWAASAGDRGAGGWGQDACGARKLAWRQPIQALTMRE